VFAVGGDDKGGEAGDGDGVSGMDDAARLAFDGLEIRGVVAVGGVGVFTVFAMIEELADGDSLDELGDAADVIDMEMGDEQVIDAGDAGVVHGLLDPAGVAAVGGGPAGVYEERSAGRGDEQRRLATLDIDGVNEQVMGGR